VGIENVVDEEEYNKFDEISSFDTSYKPQLFGTNKTPYLRSDRSEKSIYRNQGRKSNGQEMRINELASPLLRARDED
jgi:hypothetical protein